MCLAIPGRITFIDGNTAQVDFGGAVRAASVALVPKAVVGDYVLVHAGFAMQIMTEKDALETINAFRDVYGA